MGWRVSSGFAAPVSADAGVAVGGADGDVPDCGVADGSGSIREGLNFFACDFNRPPTLGGSLLAAGDAVAVRASLGPGVGLGEPFGAGVTVADICVSTERRCRGVALGAGVDGAGGEAVDCVGGRVGVSSLRVDKGEEVGVAEGEGVGRDELVPPVALGGFAALGLSDGIAVGCAAVVWLASDLTTVFAGASGGGVASDFILARACRPASVLPASAHPSSTTVC